MKDEPGCAFLLVPAFLLYITIICVGGSNHVLDAMFVSCVVTMIVNAFRVLRTDSEDGRMTERNAARTYVAATAATAEEPTDTSGNASETVTSSSGVTPDHVVCTAGPDMRTLEENVIKERLKTLSPEDTAELIRDVIWGLAERMPHTVGSGDDIQVLFVRGQPVDKSALTNGRLTHDDLVDVVKSVRDLNCVCVVRSDHFTFTVDEDQTFSGWQDVVIEWLSGTYRDHQRKIALMEKLGLIVPDWISNGDG